MLFALRDNNNVFQFKLNQLVYKNLEKQSEFLSWT